MNPKPARAFLQYGLVGVAVGASWTAVLYRNFAVNQELDTLFLTAFYVSMYGAFFGAFAVVAGFARGLRQRAEFEPTFFVLLFVPAVAFLLAVTAGLLSLSATVAGGLILAISALWWFLARMTRHAGAVSTRALILLASAASLVVLAPPVADVVAESRVRSPELPYVGEADRTLHILALDGLDPTLSGELIEEGELPNLAWLRDNSIWMPVAPISGSSPLVWTSYVTGRAPVDHGITAFVGHFLLGSRVRIPETELDFLLFALEVLSPGVRLQAPLDSRARRVPALWDLIGAAGGSSLFVNWWFTEPVGEPRGVMISPGAFPQAPEDLDVVLTTTILPGAIYPPEITDSVRRRIRDSVDVVGGRSRVNLHRANAHAAWALYLDLCTPAHAVCAVYERTIDIASHQYSFQVFGESRDPVQRPLPPTVDRETAEGWFEQFVLEAYRSVDARIGEALAALPEGDDLVLLSDHGWRYDGTEHSQWTDGEVVRSWPEGIVMFYGPSFRDAAEAPRVQTLDVFPTLAVLLGLPLSDELPGHALNVVIGGYPAAPRSVRTYGRLLPGVSTRSRSTDVKQLEDLRALGYIQ